MSTEEIKMIVELLNTATTEAVNLIILLMVKDIVIHLFAFGLGFTLLLKGIQLAKHAINLNTFGGQVAEKLNIDTYYHREMVKGLRKLDELIENG